MADAKGKVIELMKEIESNVRKVLIRDPNLVEALKSHLKDLPSAKMRKARPQDKMIPSAKLENPFEEEIPDKKF